MSLCLREMKAIKSTRTSLPVIPSSSHLQNLIKSSHNLKPKSLNLLLSNHSRNPMSIPPSLRLSSSQTPYPLPHQPFKLNLDTLQIPSFSSTPTRFLSIKPITIERLSTKRIFLTPSSSPSPELQPLDELPEKLQEIIKLFQGVKERRAKYEQLLFYGRNLEPWDDKFKTSENKVQGCVSQVWVRAYLDSDKNVIFQADSDSSLTKGLAALLVQGLSGRPVEEIVRVSPDFVALLGLQQSLTPSRNNGFLNMLKLMQKKALRLYLEAEKYGTADNGLLSGPAEDSILTMKSDGRNEDDLEAEKDGAAGIGLQNGPAEDSMLTMKSDGGNGDVKTGLSSTELAGDLKSANGSNGGLGSRGLRIKEKLERELKPIELEIEDISYQHAGHAGVRDSNGETHFNVKVVSGEFEGKSLVKRHRLIYNLLQDELQCGLHALSIVAKTPSELNTS